MNPVIETERMILSPVSASDASELHRIWIQPAVRKYLCDDLIWPLNQIQSTVEQSAIAFQEGRYGMWIARLKSQEAMVGFTGFWPFFDPPDIQLIYGLASANWGKGLATEMGQAMLDYGFQTYGFARIRASCNVPNTASIAVMERLGMTFLKQEAIDGQEIIFYEAQKTASAK
ncbi:GNAT family N-acetyltransferase [Pseudanabaena sp. PCC 6802]|uniref:GNAT family N-acetyltransferase n=1 Tax=Pseudanabaena sp. PCC 6802 TaxID=118173 RepID=UPI000345C593|nr:GNAT family N-acetyltransferase [Pseudanabaena sp. PCC 6802]